MLARYEKKPQKNYLKKINVIANKKTKLLYLHPYFGEVAQLVRALDS